VTVRTHSFNGIKHQVQYAARIDGVCDRPDIDDGGDPVLIVLDENTTKGLHSQLHEGLEASHFCDACLCGERVGEKPGGLHDDTRVDD